MAAFLPSECVHCMKGAEYIYIYIYQCSSSLSQTSGNRNVTSIVLITTTAWHIKKWNGVVRIKWLIVYFKIALNNCVPVMLKIY